MGPGSFDTPEKQYAYGVNMAISVSTGKMTSWFGRNIDRDYDPETSRGYHDAMALLNKVVEYGDAPEGDFQHLLDEQRQLSELVETPVMGDSPQNVWERGLNQLSLVLDVLHDEEVVKRGGLSDAEQESFVMNATNAMWCFEEVETNGWETEFSPSFAKAARDLVEGFLNGDKDQIMRGRERAIATATSFAKKQEMT
jgi:hypothetical protein